MSGGQKAFGNASRVSGPTQYGAPGGSNVVITGVNGIDAFDRFTWGAVGLVSPAQDAYPLGGDALQTAAYAYLLDVATGDWRAVPSSNNLTDSQPLLAGGMAPTLSTPQLFDGVASDRARSASSGNAATSGLSGVALVAGAPNWSQGASPAAAALASSARASGGAGSRHVCTSIAATLMIPPAVNQPAVQVVLRDGAAGVGAILWTQTLGVGAAVANGLFQSIAISGLNIMGSDAAAMTLEFTAAGVATTLESVSFTGYTVGA